MSLRSNLLFNGRLLTALAYGASVVEKYILLATPYNLK
jgi:hypothetical protein